MRHRPVASDIVIGSMKKKEPPRHHEKLIADLHLDKKGQTPEPTAVGNGNGLEPKKKVRLSRPLF